MLNAHMASMERKTKENYLNTVLANSLGNGLITASLQSSAKWGPQIG